jgi:hypothetical protein
VARYTAIKGWLVRRMYSLGWGIVALLAQVVSSSSAGAQLRCPGAEQISVGLSSAAPSGASREPAVPPTGDFVVFSSKASNLSNLFVPGVSSDSPNIYRYSPVDGVQLISVNSVDGNAPSKDDGVNLLFGCLGPSVSEPISDGSYGVAFHSDARDLVPEFNSTAQGIATNVFVRFPALGSTVLISKMFNDPGNNAANDSSDQATIALIGVNPPRYRVCFRSSATNLIVNQDGPNALYCKTLEISGKTVTQGDTAIVKPNPLGGSLGRPALSADGKVLVFESDATIVPGKTKNGFLQIYTYSFETQTFRLISANAAGLPAIGTSDMASISRDGSTVVFRYSGDDLSGAANLKGFEGTEATFLVRHSAALDTNSQVNTSASGVPSNAVAYGGRIDSSGKYVVFSDNGSNLVAGASGGFKQTYVKSLETGEVVRMSVTSGNVSGDQDSGYNSNNSFASAVAIGHRASDEASPFVAFASFAPNLASVGAPNSTLPFVFRSVLVTPTPTPTPTPAPRVFKKNIRITEPPEVEILGKRPNGQYDIEVTCEQFTVASSMVNQSKEFFEMLASKKARLSYVVEIRKAGSRKRQIRISSRNVVTIRKLTPGRYNIRYKVVVTVGKKKLQSRTSPSATVNLS